MIAREWMGDRSAGSLGFLAVLVAVALAVQSLVVPVDADVSWLITVSERVLSGDRLYIDIFEVNPPASVWLYLPQVWLAQFLGLRPEPVIVTLAALFAAGASWVTVRLAEPLGVAPRPALLAAIGFILIVLPGGLYAQREHYALILALPLAVAFARIASDRPLSFRAVVAAGLAAGLIVVIKPHFLFAILLPAVYALWTRRAWRSVLIGAAVAAAVVAAYAAAILLIAPAYLEFLPMLAEVYGPMRTDILRLLSGPAVLAPIALSAFAVTQRVRPLSPVIASLLLMVAGFTMAVLIQGKGYWNHALPGLGLALAAIAFALADPRRKRASIVLPAVAGALALGLAAILLTIQPPPGLVGAIRSNVSGRPTVMTLGTELATGHPAVRLAGGRWVGSRAALFTAAGVRYRTAGGARRATPALEHWYHEDLDIFARDVSRHRPDILLVEDKPRAWLLREPPIRSAMRSYRPLARAGDIEVWRRIASPGKDPADQSPLPASGANL